MDTGDTHESRSAAKQSLMAWIPSDNISLAKLIIVLSLSSLCGIVVLTALISLQDFDCNIAIGAQTINNTSGKEDVGEVNVPEYLEPLLPGIMSGKSKPRLVFAAELNWAPYAYINPRTGNMEGISVHIIKGMGELCNFDITITETKWTECWTNEAVGRGLLNGHYHGCMTYAHSKGARDRQMDFSHAFLKDDKPAGLLVRLNEDGTPEIDGNHNLAGKKVVHVNGWAPTDDSLGFVVNSCTGESFSGYTMVSSSENLPNDDALQKLLDGTVDAMFVYMDQGENYFNAGCIASDPGKKSSSPEWDCAKWAGFGTKFAFVQSGQYGHSVNGTTLSVSKKGSGLEDIVDPCLDRFMRTEEYYKVCMKHGLAQKCYPNAFFPATYTSSTLPLWETKAKELQSNCSDGYCPCPA